MPITAELENVKKFESVGFTHDQAEVLAEVHEASVQNHNQSLKEYLDQKFESLENKFSAEIREVRLEIKASQSDLLIKIFGIVFGCSTLAVAILKLIL